jgi:hypothetical protein
MKTVEKSITTTLDMLNSTVMGRAKALEFGLDAALKLVPDATYVTITVYKIVEVDEEPAWRDADPLPKGFKA